MPVCKSCKEEWTWGETMKKSFTLAAGITCPHCEKKQYLTASSRKKSSLSIFLIPLVMLISLLFDNSSPLFLFFLIGIGALVMSIQPFIMELSNEEEQLW
ncbi:cxxc_20_cxxc protein [Halobacillus alkaliphilus]|uniref:Cxxc_20_cxxc protein n=1 Tax=Halobacillus alkaliphilus TaxID=396056 RepID=A0A1I2TYK4_9BACI|nr:TIGR04104 family putative zinc finger protein [Halobacillus alkaliphilus]SFG68457.1 cxxc_20_cxxc protein [Halobacillus alkaliphilus]